MMSHSERQRAVALLEEQLTPQRLERIDSTVANRMRGLTVVLEDLYDAGNRSAVYRSAEAHGLRDVHIIRPERATKPHARQVSRGAEKWLNRHQHESTSACIAQLRRDGYRILVSDLEAARPLTSYSFEEPVALAFGNERDGVTDELRDIADGRFIIPMRGFVQSFNIAVAASITLSHARLERERALGAQSDLPLDERARLRADYVFRAVSNADRILERAGIDWSPEDDRADEDRPGS